mgnify:CR=1 FL=1
MVQRGHRVVALTRLSSAREHLADLDIVWVEGDVTDGVALAAHVAKFKKRAADDGRGSWLVHGAAVISYATLSGDLQEAVNVVGTQNAVRAARAAAVDRLLHVSSVVAVGIAPDAASQIDESAVIQCVQANCGKSAVGDYMRTKVLAEAEVLAAVRDGLDAVIVNPGAIFGEAPVPSNTAHLLMRVDRGGIGRLAGPGSLSVVGVRDVARGMALALERGRRGERYLLCERSLRLAELMEHVVRELGLAARIHPIGARTWRALVATTRIVDRVKPLRVVTPTALELLGLHFRFDCTKARTELGWDPQPFPEVLSETVNWLRRIGEIQKH